MLHVWGYPGLSSAFDLMTLRKEGRESDILFPLLEGVESESVSYEYVNGVGGGREGGGA